MDVPTISGPVSMTIPKGSNTGSTLRLKGRGIKRPRAASAGDQYVVLKVMLPENADADLEAFVETWSQNNDYQVRKDS